MKVSTIKIMKTKTKKKITAFCNESFLSDSIMKTSNKFNEFQ